MLTKLKNLLRKPFSRPATIITLGITVVLAAMPLMAFLVLIIDWFEPWYSDLFYYLSPRSLFYALPILLSVSYLVLLLQNYFSEKRPQIKLLKRVLITTLIELVIYFWYKAVWGHYMYNEFFSGDFGNLPLGDRLNIFQSYAMALLKTTAVSCLAIIAWLFLKTIPKRNS